MPNSGALRATFRTFGCKLNQTETESLADAFARSGARLVDWSQAIGGGERADVFVFNTCTVTTKAEQKARREMRLAMRANPEALILVSGCYAEMEPEHILSLAPRLVVLPGRQKSRIATLAGELVNAFADKLDIYEHARATLAAMDGCTPDPFSYIPGALHFHTRPTLKIQDGCDNRCSYCRVCLARGPSVSLNPATVIDRARDIASRGAQEIVLVGVNLSQYSAGGLGFSALLELLLRETDTVAYRISSWEPNKVDDAFLKVVSDSRVRPHLHLAVQSGSDSVLAAMNRAYKSEEMLSFIRQVRSVKGDPFIGADIIAGFPGESDAQFSETLDFVNQAEFAWIHAFTYSPRPGTPAFGMRPLVPERIAVARSAELLRIGQAGRAAFIDRRLGCKFEAMLENEDSGFADPYRNALTPDYLNLKVEGVPVGRSGTVSVCIESRIFGIGEAGFDAHAGYLLR